VTVVNCQDVVRKLWDFLDEELDEERMAAVRAHIARCNSCYPHVDFERAFLDALAECRQTGGCPEEVRRRVVEALRQEGYSGGM
jgi:anti-sigma factor (TIGR02949 family)